MRPVHFLAGLALAASFSLVACGGDSTAPQPSISGTYNLRTVNGANLPYTAYQSTTEKIEIIADVITASGGSFTEFTTYRVTVNGQVGNETGSDAGSYVTTGTNVSFSLNSGSTGTGTISGNAFIMAFPGVSFYYVRQ